MTNISIDNGQTIDDLLDMLASVSLDATFEDYGNFIIHNPQWMKRTGEGYCSNTVPASSPYDEDVVVFWGNFYQHSFSFDIHTNEQDVIDKLTKAIRNNQQRPDYLAQKGKEK